MREGCILIEEAAPGYRHGRDTAAPAELGSVGYNYTPTDLFILATRSRDMPEECKICTSTSPRLPFGYIDCA